METTNIPSETAVKEQVSSFIVKNFLFGDAAKRPADSASLIESGIIDSTGILELIEFLETEFGIKVQEHETVPANLDSVANLAAFIRKKARE